MALFKTRSAAVYGVDAHLIDVEVDLHSVGSARDSRMGADAPSNMQWQVTAEAKAKDRIE